MERFPARRAPGVGLRREIAKPDHIVGGHPDQAKRAGHQSRRNRIWRVGAHPLMAVDAAIAQTVLFEEQADVVTDRIGEFAALGVEPAQRDQIPRSRADCQHLAAAAGALPQSRQKARRRVGVEISEAAIALAGHPADQHPHLAEDADQRPPAHPALAGRRIGPERPQEEAERLAELRPGRIGEATAVRQHKRPVDRAGAVGHPRPVEVEAPDRIGPE